METFDPYQPLPFKAYGLFDGVQVEQETCASLMHYVEAEKFLGVDEQYGRFILSIQEKEDFMLETAGVSQARRRQDWFDVRERLIRAGAWMQLVQNKDELCDRLLAGELVCNLGPINDAMASIRERLLSDDPLRKVLITGAVDFTDQAAVFAMLDSIFARRQADEIIVTAELGVGRIAARYAHQHYIPIRVVGDTTESDESVLELVLTHASHVFVATHHGQSSPFADTCFEAAAEAGKFAHKVQLELLCA